MTLTSRPGITGATDLYSEILPGLFQGGTADDETINYAQELRYFDGGNEFDSIVTLYAWAAPANWGVEERRFGFPDAEVIEDYLPTVHELATWAYQQWQGGKRVLIRCQAGLNRSGLITALVLIHHGYTAEDAIALLRERRSEWALCNTHYVNYLLSGHPWTMLTSSDSSTPLIGN
jgi:hypothetical protein